MEDKGRVEGGEWSPRGKKRHLKASPGYSTVLVAVLWSYALHFQASRDGFHRDLLGFVLHHSHRSFCVLRCFSGAEAGLELWVFLPPPPKLRSQACAETGSA